MLALRRIESLDALRGIAALIVVFHHLRMVFDAFYLDGRRYTLIRILFAGDASVYVFFALSGFVLNLSLERRDEFRYLPYLVRRMIRLYLPLAVAIIASAMLYTFISPQPIPGSTQWLAENSWSHYPSPSLIAGHLALLDGKQYHTLDNVMWSLIHEIRISIIFPFLALLILRKPLVTLLGCAVISVIAHFWSWSFYPDVFNPVLTLQFLFLFAAGAWLCRNREDVSAHLAAFPAWPFLLASWVLLSWHGSSAFFFLTAGAIILVAICFAHSDIERVMAWKPFVWLGRVSYSLYLVHLPIMLSLVYLFHSHWAVYIGTLLISPIAAELFYIGVESKAANLGKLAGAAITRRQAVALKK